MTDDNPLEGAHAEVLSTPAAQRGAIRIRLPISDTLSNEESIRQSKAYYAALEKLGAVPVMEDTSERINAVRATNVNGELYEKLQKEYHMVFDKPFPVMG